MKNNFRRKTCPLNPNLGSALNAARHRRTDVLCGPRGEMFAHPWHIPYISIESLAYIVSVFIQIFLVGAVNRFLLLQECVSAVQLVIRWRCSRYWTRSPILGSTRALILSSSAVKLFSKYSNLCDHSTWTSRSHGQTSADRRTDDVA